MQVCKYNSLGKHALLTHAKGDSHKYISDGVKKRSQGQIYMSKASEVSDINENQAGGLREKDNIRGA